MLIAKITDAHGSVSTMSVTAEAALPGETLTDTISRVAKKYAPAGATIEVVDASTITPSLSQLSAYANNKAMALLASLRNYSVNGVVLVADATPATRTDIGNLAQWGQTNLASVQPWVDSLGGVTSATGAQYVELAPLVGDYALSVYSTLGSVLLDIKAGTTTTAAQIDAAAWPV